MPAATSVLAKLALGIGAISSGIWAAFFLLHPDQSVQLNDVANRIMSGAGFQQNPLPESSQYLENAQKRAICDPLEERAAAIIQLRMFEDAVNASDTRLADQRLDELRSSADLALGCVPTEGFLWFILYWSAVHRGAPANDHFEELRMSYLHSPFEGWIALRRSPYALAIYGNLPADLKEMARNEFVAIVASGFVSDAARILMGPGWTIRDELLPKLANVRVDFRIDLGKKMRSEGLPVDIPGIETLEFRPWH
jgi:hypothetical protein